MLPIDTTATTVVICLSIVTLFASECIYKFFVFDTKSYKEATQRFCSLTGRQQILSKKERQMKKKDETMTEEET
jgi:hypothetical protein